MWTFHENDFMLIKSCELRENEHGLKARTEHEIKDLIAIGSLMKF